jgi:hypothetical protein
MLDKQEPSGTGVYQPETDTPLIERDREVESVKPLDVLLSESKQLQAAAMQLIRESRDRRTILGLTMHLCKHHSKQLEPYLSGKSSYNSSIANEGNHRPLSPWMREI